MNAMNLNQTEKYTDNLNTEISNTLDALRSGQVILYPTDTIWGLGCDSRNESAIERIYEIKERPRHLPLILLVDSIEMLKSHIQSLHPRIETLLVHHLKPLTLIYKNPINIHKSLLANDGSIAIRICHDPFCNKLIEEFNYPIVSTSANKHKQEIPKSFAEIDNQLLKQVDYICDYRRGELMDNAPSVIATFNNKGELDFLRE